MYTTTPCGTAACVMNAKQHTKSIGGITRAMERNYIWPFANIVACISYKYITFRQCIKKYVYLEVEVGVFSFTLGEIFVSKWAIFDGVP